MLQEWDSKNFDHVIDLLTLAADYDMTAVGNDVNDVLFGIKEAIAGSPSYALMIRAKDLTGHYKVVGNAWVKEGDADDMRLEFSDRSGAPCVFSMVKGGQMRHAKLPLDGTRTGFGQLLSDEFVPMLGEPIQKVMAYLDDVEYINADIPDYIDIAVTQGERTLATVNITHNTTTEGENLKGLLVSNHAKISRSDGTGYNELILRNSGYQPGAVGVNLDFEVKTPSKTLFSIKFSMPGTINNDLKYLVKNLERFQPEMSCMVPMMLDLLVRKLKKQIADSGKQEQFDRMITLTKALRKAHIDLRRKVFAEVLKPLGGTLRMIICGGAALSQETVDFLSNIGVEIYNGYGITECTHD